MLRDLRYGLHVEVRSDSLAYTGRVKISAAELPAQITLDSVAHEISAVRAGSTGLEYRRPPDRPDELVISGIPSGTTAIDVEFSGQVDDRGVRGFHLSPLGAGRLYTTYLEPVAARRVFPCFDRPDEKAVFEVEVTAPRGVSVISNTTVSETVELDGGRKRVRFDATPPMSTYLLYLGIGPFEEIHGERQEPRVILAGAPGATQNGRFAVRQAERAVEYFNRYYGERYPLPKLHLIAVPQFGTGAMENWGAIAFQEYLLLFDERAPLRTKMVSVEVICHEIAHQWFGDLVTMRWWNDLWLNESFATFVAAKASDALFPEWQQQDEFLGERNSSALFWDAMPHTHPIRVDVQDPNQIRQIFDDISYGKGASVLRMAEAFVGEEAFRRGVSEYLAAHRYGNADASDLWKAVGAASEPGVERMFTEWVERPGLPIVSAQLTGSTLSLEQHRFSLMDSPPSDRPWPIPLQVADARTTHRRMFDQERISIGGVEGVPVVNPGRRGFYRVRYEGPLRDRMVEEYPRLAPVDRWGLQSDNLAFFLAGALSFDDYTRLLRLLLNETDPLVLGGLSDLAAFRYPLVHRIPRWEAVLREIVIAQSERLGLSSANGEDGRVGVLREEVTIARVRLDPAFARSLGTSYASLDAVDPNVRRPVLAARAALAGPAEYQELRARLARETSGEGRMNLANALGFVPRSDWLRESLDLLVTGELFLGPWGRLIGAAVLWNPDHADAVWSFLSERHEELLRVLAGTGTQGPMLQLVLPAVGLARPVEVREFLARREIPDARRAVQNSLDLLDLYERVLARARA